MVGPLENTRLQVGLDQAELVRLALILRGVQGKAICEFPALRC
jgi:hypothetical protein